MNEQELLQGQIGFQITHHSSEGRCYLGSVPELAELCPLVQKEVRMFSFRLEFEEHSMVRSQRLSGAEMLSI